MMYTEDERFFGNERKKKRSLYLYMQTTKCSEIYRVKHIIYTVCIIPSPLHVFLSHLPNENRANRLPAFSVAWSFFVKFRAFSPRVVRRPKHARWMATRDDEILCWLRHNTVRDTTVCEQSATAIPKIHRRLPFAMWMPASRISIARGHGAIGRTNSRSECAL